MNLRFRGALADAENGRDFVMLKTFDVVQDERGARTLWKPLDGSLELEPPDSTITHGSGSCHRLLVQCCRRSSRFGLAALQVIEAPVHRQAIQPCSDRRLAAKFRELSIGQQKNFLQQVLGVRPRTTHPPREVEQPRGMLAIQLLESWNISFGHSQTLDDSAMCRVALRWTGRKIYKCLRLCSLPTLAGPASLCEVGDASARNDDALCEEERAFGEQVAAVPAQFASRGNDAVTGD